MLDQEYRGYRFPKDIIARFGRIFAFGVSFLDVEDMMAALGVLVTYETSGGGATSLGSSLPTVLDGGARGPAINGKLLIRAADENRCVPEHENTPKLLVLADDESSHVRRRVALHANIASKILTKVADQKRDGRTKSGTQSPSPRRCTSPQSAYPWADRTMGRYWMIHCYCAH